MDANGTRFLLLQHAEDFSVGADCRWNPLGGALTLTQRHELRLPRPTAAEALAAWQAAGPLAVDGFGQFGRLSDDRNTFEYALRWPPAVRRPVLASSAAGAGPTAEAATLDPVDAPAGCRFTDLHLGGEGLAALGYAGGGSRGLKLVHLRARWQADCTLSVEPTRVWVDRDNRCWAAGDSRLALCTGSPLPLPYFPRPDRFEPVAVNPHALAERWAQDLPPGLRLRGLCADEERLYLLAWLADAPDPESGEPWQAIVSRPLHADAGAPLTIWPLDPAVPPATDVAAVGPGLLALLVPRKASDTAFRRRDCPVVELKSTPEGPRAGLVEVRYPQRSQRLARFVRGLDHVVRYLAEEGPRELHPLAQARFPAQGAAEARRPLDSGDPDTLWHRLFLDACIPPGCRLLVDARAADTREGLAREAWSVQPEPLWVPLASELPFRDPAHGGIEKGRRGLFEVLFQKPNGRVRELRGRYLGLRFHFSGDGRTSPDVRAVRVYYPRFSWQQAHLPQHLHQQERPSALPPAALEPANAADIRERLLAAFEGLLTPIEDRIAASEQLFTPESAPAALLPRLAEALGGRLPDHWTEERRRRWLGELGRRQRRRGTLAGLSLALDVATDGAVGRGQVVPVETFRLRRTLATVLGISLDDAGHPLTLGTGLSGNSIVGETLILSDEDSREFLALFAPELLRRRRGTSAAERRQLAADRRAVEAFFDRYSHRLTVLLHGEARALRPTVEEVLAAEVPAHLKWVVRETNHPFVLGLSPLLGIDTFLERQPPVGRVAADRTRLGRGDLLRNPVALSPEHATPTRDETS